MTRRTAFTVHPHPDATPGEVCPWVPIRRVGGRWYRAELVMVVTPVDFAALASGRPPCA